MKKSLVVIPVFNEEQTIESVLNEVCKHYAGEVLIVNDGSSDRSMERIAVCIQPRLEVLNHESQRGYGQSLIDGFKHAIDRSYDVVVTMDCDFQHEPSQISEFIERIEGCDVLSGSRYLRENEADDQAPPDRQRINRIVTTRINELTGFRLTDAFCGFKAYRVEALSKLDLSETGYAFPLQFWIQAKAAGLVVRELPVARIYNQPKRSFGAQLDNPEQRLAYYTEVIDREVKRWKLM